MLSHLISITSKLKWALTFTLHRSFFWSSGLDYHVAYSVEVLDQARNSTQLVAPADCAICLCKIDNIEGGEEISEPRCGHVFHRVCMDRWLAFRHSTCPLCRDFLLPVTTVTEFGTEVLVLEFCSLSSSTSDRDNWWLR
ncbi:probable E3 ubiquitin-protein ligase XERICO [Tripterygium wilfordii]|uniref:probable E3 ubiquitin-protein ligase XERICO n=1 Tax=Tripterygium wilfordii TaxID=458696 RepID=UPI0018F8365E|nr:probable E3 ubiquitin-protein ligase XERICO [Tripterygium wilfordii]